MELDVAALLADDLFELAFRRIEGLAQRHIDVLVLIPGGDDLVLRHTHVYAHLEVLALMMMLARLSTVTRRLVMRG